MKGPYLRNRNQRVKDDTLALCVRTSRPVQDPQRPQRDPATRRADGFGRRQMQRVLVPHVEQPASIRLAAIADAPDGFLDLRIRSDTCAAQIVERAQHVVMPERRKREASPVRIDHLAGGQPAQQLPFEEIALAALPSARRGRRGAVGPLEREKPFEHTDGGMEGRSDGAAFGVAIPSAIGELLTDQSLEQPIAANVEVRAQAEDTAVDARFDFALEEWRVAEFRAPGDLCADPVAGSADSLVRRIDPEIAQQHERVHVRPPERGRHPVAPLTIRTL
jgi:hypothetical protein